MRACSICVSDASNIASDIPGAAAEPPLAAAEKVSLGKSQTMYYNYWDYQATYQQLQRKLLTFESVIRVT